MSILDTAPKTSVKLLIGRENKLREMVRSVLEHRITVVLGSRRIGKTSIVKTALAVLSRRERLDDVKIEDRFVPIYVNMWDIVAVTESSRNFFEHLHYLITKALDENDRGIARKYTENTRRELA